MDFSWSKFDLQGLPTRIISHRFVHTCKRTFPVQANSQKALKNTFRATTFKVQDNSRTFQGKMEFKDFSRTTYEFQGLFKTWGTLLQAQPDGFVLWVVKCATSLFNLSCSNVAKKVEHLCCLFYHSVMGVCFGQMQVTQNLVAFQQNLNIIEDHGTRKICSL